MKNKVHLMDYYSLPTCGKCLDIISYNSIIIKDTKKTNEAI